MLEPDEIINFIEQDTLENLPLFKKNILVTAGPTFEPIDPVRFIGNHSSGKMGFALAEEAAKLGAEVTLITGPTSVSTTHNIKIINVVTAEQMFREVNKNFDKIDIAIASAAVSDFKPKDYKKNKIKKENNLESIKLEPTKDILSWMGNNKKQKFLVGFALETEDEVKSALKKLRSKNLDLIIMNSLNEAGAGFSIDTNKISLINKKEEILKFELKPKKDVAKDIFSQILKEHA